MSALAAAMLMGLAAALLVPSVRQLRIRALGPPTPPSPVVRVRSHLASLVTRVTAGPRARRRRAQQRSRTIGALSALAAELEAGQPPATAVLRASGEPCAWPHAERAARWGGDVAAAFDVDAEQAPVLAQVAACWRVGAHGTGLADSLRTVAASARAAEEVRVEMEGQLAGPRATARMLSLLPVVGIALGSLMGSDPLTWLLGTLPGRLCLAAGLVLTAIGTWWTGRIAASVERRL